MIRAAIILCLIGSTSVAQDWSFRINVNDGMINESRSGTLQSEFSNAESPYFSAEAYADVPTGALPPCQMVTAFEVDIFFGWGGETNGHIMTNIIKSDDGTWRNDAPWLIVSRNINTETLIDDAANITLQNVSCNDNGQLDLALIVRGNVEGETETFPVKLSATAQTPILHIDDY